MEIALLKGLSVGVFPIKLDAPVDDDKRLCSFNVVHSGRNSVMV